MASRPQATSMTTRRRKRVQPPVFGGIGSFSDKDNDYVCPVCFDLIDEAHMTKCGHTFCYKCIKQNLTQSNRCPKCNYLLSSDDIYPNFLLNELILKHRSKIEDKKMKFGNQNGLSSQALGDMLKDDNMDLYSINHLLDYLTKKKSQLIHDSKNVQYQILHEFLQEMRQRKQQQLDEIQNDLTIIDRDLKKSQEFHDELRKTQASHSPLPVLSLPALPNGLEEPVAGTSTHTPSSTVHPHPSLSPQLSSAATTHMPLMSAHALASNADSFNGSSGMGRSWLQTTVASRRKRVAQHFDDLQEFYFTSRRQHPASEDNADTGLSQVVDCLAKFTRFTTFRPLATLNYASDIYNGSSIVSSIEFDRDCDYFAIAGVTKKIKVFEYETMIRDAVDIHYPVNEMICNSKISSLTWSTYHKALMASSDYEGTVTLWDAFTGVKSKVFQEHEKRCWSVDFNKMDPKLLASGSDDAKVKVWSTNSDHSLSSLEAKANVCCVKFSPTSRFHLAFGSADHCVHYYDLRNTKQAVMVFRGHKKAVSYVKFLDSQSLVSASTDSQLKSWSLAQSSAVRTFTGHVNDKNFVGLATDGSENNSLYIYYKGLSMHMLSYKFDTVRSVLEKEKKEEDTNEFVSAVSWRPGSNVLVAANSQGTVKLLELV